MGLEVIDFSDQIITIIDPFGDSVPIDGLGSKFSRRIQHRLILLNRSRVGRDKHRQNLRVIFFVIGRHLILDLFDLYICQVIGVKMSRKVMKSPVGKGVALGGACPQKNEEPYSKEDCIFSHF